MTFGQRLKELRGNHTLREAADRSGLSLSYLNDLERGRTVPSIKVLVGLANLYTLSVVELIEPVVWDQEQYHPVLPFMEGIDECAS
jgi:transcriptional regulator with XRE-family HTH domain